MGRSPRRRALGACLQGDADYLRWAEKTYRHCTVSDAVADIHRSLLKIGEAGNVVLLLSASDRCSQERQSNLSAVGVATEHQVDMLNKVTVKRDGDVWIMREQQF